MKVSEVRRTMDKEEILAAYDGVIFDPEYVIDEEHVLFAYYHTKKAFERGSSVANDPKIEFLVRLSGEPQISKAVQLGIHERMSRIGVLVPEEEGISPIIGDKEKIREFFGTVDKREIFEKIAVIEIR